MTIETLDQKAAAANHEALQRLHDAQPRVVDVKPAGEALPNYRENLVLTSGAPLTWEEYEGGQREALIGGALFEGLAQTREEAIQSFKSGSIEIGSCHDYGAVGSLAGIYTASMPVFTVTDECHGNSGFCNFYEGSNPRRLNYGCYGEDVFEQLRYVQMVLAPVIGEAIRRTGGVDLKHLMARALRMGDELHSRNAAASLLFSRALLPAFLDMSATADDAVHNAVVHLSQNDYFFLRLSMAAAKATADNIACIEGATIVSAMAFSCKGFSIRVSGLGDTWFTGPPPIHEGRLFEGHSEDEITWMGGESTITETIGLGGFAQACALPLQGYQGGSADTMIQRNREMYAITATENSHYKIPLFDFCGTPTGIDIRRVLKTGTLPVMDVGLAGKDGGQIGAGVIRAPRECFELAAQAYEKYYGDLPEGEKDVYKR